MRAFLCLLTLALSPALLAHGTHKAVADDPSGRFISFPDGEGFKVLTLDPHTHSVFSDGHVWPYIRVEEALRDGLDAFAVTEHLEYQPHLADIPHPDRNRSVAEARQSAKETDLIIIAGSEITRDQPVGHINALFVKDANALVRWPRGLEAGDVRGHYDAAKAFDAAAILREAKAQSAFVFLNHPHWTAQQSNGKARLTPFHKAMIEEALIQGIEVANGADYSEEAFKLALENDLTVIGTSDIHNLIDWDYPPAEGAHRPVTLVLAEARTEDAIKKALLERRTVAWFKNLLIGRPREVEAIVNASISVANAAYVGDLEILEVTLHNDSDAVFELENRSEFTFMEQGDDLKLPAHGSLTLSIKTGVRRDSVVLPFSVRNALVAPKEHATWRLSIAL